MRTGTQIKDRAMGSPWTYSLLGAVVGGLVGRTVMMNRSNHERRYSGSYAFEDDSGYEEGGGRLRDVKERIGDAVTSGKERVEHAVASGKEQLGSALGEVRTRTREGVQELRERAPDPQMLKARASHWVQDMSEDNPAVLAIVALGLGALASWLVPVSNTERRALAGVKQAAQEKASMIGEQLHEKVGELQEKAQGAIQGDQSQPQSQPRQPSPGIDSLPPMH